MWAEMGGIITNYVKAPHDRQVAREKTKLAEEDLKDLLNPMRMTEPGFGGRPASG